MWQSLAPFKTQLIIGPFFKLLEAILELMIPTLMAKIIDTGIKGGDKKYILQMGGVMLLVAVVGLLCAYVCQYSASIASQGFGTRMRSTVFAHILNLPYASIEKYGAAALATRVTNDINLMQQGVAMFIRLFIRAPFICIGSIVMAAFISKTAAVFLLIGMLLSSAVIALIMAISTPMYKTVQEKTDELAQITDENLVGTRVVRAFNKKGAEEQRFMAVSAARRGIGTRAGKIAALINPATSLIINLAIALILFFGADWVNTGMVSQGEMTALVSYASYMLSALVALAVLLALLSRAAASSKRVSALLDEKTLDHSALPLDKTLPETHIGEPLLEFKNVSFSYSGADDAVNNISFKLNQGERLGIIGATGAGKSTLISLLLRFYSIDSGEILFKGNNIYNYSLHALRSQIAFAGQNAELFSGTVAENVLQGAAGASTAVAESALKTAMADSFVHAKRHGIMSHVSRGGSNFSGGQQQRLSIARAIASGSSLMIFDNCFASLDNITSKQLMNNLLSDNSGRSIIFVSQKAQIAMHCDRILVLRGGEIIAEGTHSELFSSCDYYRQICEIQLDGRGRGNV